jgi:Zn finger protein HypA/HybF involved in hydrogenase expression
MFISKVIERYGSDNIDFSLCSYITAREPVTLICKVHNCTFSIVPDKVLSKRNGEYVCPKCSKEHSRDIFKEKASLNFLNKARAKFGDKFDYSLVDYINAKTPVKIRCTEHLEIFEVMPDTHTRSTSRGGCPVCHKEAMGQYHRLSLVDFIDRAKRIHGEHYDYSEIIEFKNAHTKVPIICNKGHGIFLQTVSNHIYNKFGCPTCGNEVTGEKRKLPQDEFISRSKTLYGERFDYNSVVYDGYYKPVKIYCKEHDNLFEQQPANHLQGVGCKYCIDKGYSRDKSGYLYINKITDGVIKVGITNVCPIERAKVLSRKSLYNIVNLFYFYHENGDFIYQLEQKILKDFPRSIIDKSKMKSGYTETISSEFLPQIIDTIVYHFTNTA